MLYWSKREHASQLQGRLKHTTNIYMGYPEPSFQFVVAGFLLPWLWTQKRATVWAAKCWLSFWAFGMGFSIRNYCHSSMTDKNETGNDRREIRLNLCYSKGYKHPRGWVNIIVPVLAAWQIFTNHSHHHSIPTSPPKPGPQPVTHLPSSLQPSTWQKNEGNQK